MQSDSFTADEREEAPEPVGERLSREGSVILEVDEEGEMGQESPPIPGTPDRGNE